VKDVYGFPWPPPGLLGIFLWRKTCFFAPVGAVAGRWEERGQTHTIRRVHRRRLAPREELAVHGALEPRFPRPLSLFLSLFLSHSLSPSLPLSPLSLPKHSEVACHPPREVSNQNDRVFREKGSFIHNATHAKGTYKTKTLGSRLGPLY